MSSFTNIMYSMNLCNLFSVYMRVVIGVSIVSIVIHIVLFRLVF